MERAIGGSRLRDSDRRSRGARRGGGAPAAGGGHVSRHRDFRRQHRDPRRPVHLPVAPLPCRPAQLRRCSSSVMLIGVRLCRRGRVVGRPRHADGRDLFRGAAVRSPDAAHERRCVDCCDSVLRDPLQVVDAGFALTFGATLGILVGMSKCLRAPFRRRRGCVRRPRCSLRPRARKSRCCRSARSCSRASRSPASSSTLRPFR